MKNILYVLVLLGFLNSCFSSTSPADVAEVFLESLHSKDYKTAEKYCTPESAQLLNIAMGLGGINERPPFKFLLKEENIDGDKAQVKFLNALDDKGKIDTIDLIKRDGVWLVQVKK